MSVPRRLEVTAFGPFAGVTTNASTTLLRELAAAPALLAADVGADVGNADIVFTELVTSDAAVRAYAERRTSEFAVHLGVGLESQQALLLECVANNENDFRVADEEGAQPRGVIDAAAPAQRCLDERLVHFLLKRMQASALAIDVRLSLSAGRFVCNDLFFRSLARGPCLFVHIPRTLTAEVRAGVVALVRAVREWSEHAADREQK